ncbi:MAG: hypothetical protein D4R67_08065 [Bacteroidetes bacterium]|nr:MAG: hypothetical protein D4R67_08065 [Bacteroidota bacterium]
MAMKRVISISLLFFILLVYSPVLNASQKEGIKKVIKKEFQVTPDTRLRLDNSFGDITCKLWDQKIVVVEVTISVGTRSESEADKIFSRIDIGFRESEAQIDVKTNLVKGMQAKGHFSIDYLVRMPASVPLELINKFGDVLIDELQAKSAIRVEYGKASIGKLANGDNLLEVSFGAASVKSIKGAVVSLQYSKMSVDYAGSLRLKSNYSDIRAGEVVVLEGTFEGGNIKLERASVMTLQSKYSGFTIGMVKQKINLDMDFGSFEVDEISSEFKSLVVECKYGSVNCPMPETIGYTLDAETHFGSIRFPESKATLTVAITSGQDESYRGTVGSNPTASVKIRNEFGSIKL